MVLHSCFPMSIAQPHFVFKITIVCGRGDIKAFSKFSCLNTSGRNWSGLVCFILARFKFLLFFLSRVGLQHDKTRKSKHETMCGLDKPAQWSCHCRTHSTCLLEEEHFVVDLIFSDYLPSVYIGFWASILLAYR